jgi:hypothetical protein
LDLSRRVPCAKTVPESDIFKNLFKGAAVVASIKRGPFAEFYAGLIAKGMRPEMARELTV